MMYDHVVTCDALTVEWVTVPRRWFRPCGGFLFRLRLLSSPLTCLLRFALTRQTRFWETDNKSYALDARMSKFVVR